MLQSGLQRIYDTFIHITLARFQLHDFYLTQERWGNIVFHCVLKKKLNW